MGALPGVAPVALTVDALEDDAAPPPEPFALGMNHPLACPTPIEPIEPREFIEFMPPIGIVGIVCAPPMPNERLSGLAGVAPWPCAWLARPGGMTIACGRVLVPALPAALVGGLGSAPVP